MAEKTRTSVFTLILVENRWHEAILLCRVLLLLLTVLQSISNHHATNAASVPLISTQESSPGSEFPLFHIPTFILALSLKSSREEHVKNCPETEEVNECEEGGGDIDSGSDSQESASMLSTVSVSCRKILSTKKKPHFALLWIFF